MRTLNCVKCGNPAVLWTYHVLKGSERITAGWCTYHKHVSEDWRICIPYAKLNSPGCVGVWKPEHGIRENLNDKK